MLGIQSIKYDGFLKIKSMEFDHTTDEIPRTNWEFMERGDSVVILVNIKDTKNFVVLQQFRIGDFVREGKTLSYSNPAGMIDDGETPMQAAIRELKEEIGADPVSITYLGRALPSAGGSTEVTHMFFAQVEDDEFEAIDKSEGITTSIISEKLYSAMIDNGTISSMQMQHLFLRAERADLF